MALEFKVPKLPDQDDYLLDLQNNNYSMRTVYNYARDLCIFAMFLKTHRTSFHDVDKKLITIYKGYLRNGDHISDLNDYRENVAKNAGIITESEAKPSKGSRTNETEVSGMSTPLGDDDPDGNDQDRHQTYLDDVYKKVYGSLGRLRTRIGSGSLKDSDGLSARSVNRMLSAFRSYLKYRIDFDLETPIPPDAVKLIKAPQKSKQVASFEELQDLIECPMVLEKDEKVMNRNRCMLEMLFSTGMRISELIGLNLDQVSVEGKLFIEGKGRKQRFVYLTPRAMSWLDKYLGIRLRYVSDTDDPESFDGRMPGQKLVKVSVGIEKGFAGSGDTGETDGADVSRKGDKDGETKLSAGFVNISDYQNILLLDQHRRTGFINKFDSPALFIPFSGGRNGHRSKRLSTNYFQEKIADYRRRLGIQVPTSAHSLRHGFATYLAENGAPAAAIQVLLGHESLSTTTKYVHASDKFAEQTHREKHPLN